MDVREWCSSCCRWFECVCCCCGLRGGCWRRCRGAEPVTAEGNVHDYHVARTISNGKPSVGETITVTSVLTRTGSLEYLQQVKDVHPDCLTYVKDSAKVDGDVIGSNKVEVADDYAKITGSWAVYWNDGLIKPKFRTVNSATQWARLCAECEFDV